MKTTEERVLKYVSDHDHSPLVFSDGYEPDGKSIKTLVLSVLNLMDNKCSVDEDGTIETYPGKNRSSLDIWRHILSVKQDVTIFEVMNTLFELLEDTAIGSLHCDRVQRRVFRTNKNPGWNKDYSSYDHLDEYDLCTRDWASVGKTKPVSNPDICVVYMSPEA